MKKLYFVIITILMLTLLVTACAKSTTPNAQTSQAVSQTDQVAVSVSPKIAQKASEEFNGLWKAVREEVTEKEIEDEDAFYLEIVGDTARVYNTLEDYENKNFESESMMEKQSDGSYHIPEEPISSAQTKEECYIKVTLEDANTLRSEGYRRTYIYTRQEL